jgi:hypothetical protein
VSDFRMQSSRVLVTRKFPVAFRGAIGVTSASIRVKSMKDMKNDSKLTLNRPLRRAHDFGAAGVLAGCMSRSSTSTPRNRTAAAIRWIGLAIIAVTLPFPISGATFYVRPNGGSYGLSDGSSWANAFNGFAGISWGSGSGQVKAGDTVYVAAGTYTQTFSPAGSGSSGNPITLRAAQDTYTGVATFGSIYMNNAQFITINGSFNGATNFNFPQGIVAQGSLHCKWLYFTSQSSVEVAYANYMEFGNFSLIMPATTADHAFNGNQTYPIAAWDQTLIHDGKIVIPGLVGNGAGMDGIQSGCGYTISNVVIQSVTGGSPSSSQHQDQIQLQLGKDLYVKIVNCEFIDGGDSEIDYDTYGAPAAHLYIYNCVFRSVIASMGTMPVRIYASGGGTVPYGVGIHIDNNTFIDAVNRGPSYGGAISFGNWASGATFTDCSIQNNIFYNCGRGYSIILIGPPIPQGNMVFSYNLVNAGVAGNTSLGGWTQTAGAQGGAPSFVSYTPYAVGNNLHLSAADTAARGQATSLSSYFTYDKDGNSRMLDSAWCIGAYQASNGAGTNPVVWVTPNSLNFDSTPAGSITNLTLTVMNAGGGTLSGAASVQAPFQIISGGVYTLGSNQSQTVTVRYAPTRTETDSQSITFTGGGGATIAVNGSAWGILPALSFPSYAGLVTGPFTTNGSCVSQSIQTGVTTGGRAIYGFVISNPGLYVVSANVSAPSDAANSFYVNIDASPTDPGMIWDLPISPAFTSQTVSWRGNGGTDTNSPSGFGAQYAPETFNLSAGTHQLIIVGREAGAQLGQITIQPYGATAPPTPLVSPIIQAPGDVDLTLSGMQVYGGSRVQYSSAATDPSGLALSWQWIYTVNGGAETLLQSGTGSLSPVPFNYPASAAGSTYGWKLRVSNGQTMAESDLTVGVEPMVVPLGGLTLQPSDAVITGPFTLFGGTISQSVQTSVAGGGQAVYNFSITNAGGYAVQALVNAPTDGANSFYVNVDGVPTDPTMIWDVPVTTGFLSKTVTWRGNGAANTNSLSGFDAQYSPQVFNLTAGAHQLIIVGREANALLQSVSIVPAPAPPRNFRILVAQ